MKARSGYARSVNVWDVREGCFFSLSSITGSASLGRLSGTPDQRHCLPWVCVGISDRGLRNQSHCYAQKTAANLELCWQG